MASQESKVKQENQDLKEKQELPDLKAWPGNRVNRYKIPNLNF